MRTVTPCLRMPFCGMAKTFPYLREGFSRLRPTARKKCGKSILRNNKRQDQRRLPGQPHLCLANWYSKIPQDSPSCYDSLMRNLAVLFIHFIAVLARLIGPGGVRSTGHARINDTQFFLNVMAILPRFSLTLQNAKSHRIGSRCHEKLQLFGVSVDGTNVSRPCNPLTFGQKGDRFCPI
jgi:hypothetical protein